MNDHQFRDTVNQITMKKRRRTTQHKMDFNGENGTWKLFKNPNLCRALVYMAEHAIIHPHGRWGKSATNGCAITQIFIWCIPIHGAHKTCDTQIVLFHLKFKRKDWISANGIKSFTLSVSTFLSPFESLLDRQRFASSFPKKKKETFKIRTSGLNLNSSLVQNSLSVARATS